MEILFSLYHLHYNVFESKKKPIIIIVNVNRKEIDPEIRMEWNRHKESSKEFELINNNKMVNVSQENKTVITGRKHIDTHTHTRYGKETHKKQKVCRFFFTVVCCQHPKLWSEQKKPEENEPIKQKFQSPVNYWKTRHTLIFSISKDNRYIYIVNEESV